MTIPNFQVYIFDFSKYWAKIYLILRFDSSFYNDSDDDLRKPHDLKGFLKFLPLIKCFPF